MILARRTAFSVIPSSSATRAAGMPSRANRWNAFQVVGLKSDLHGRQDLLNHVLVVLAVPLAGQVAIGIGHLVEKPVRQIQPDRGPPVALLAEVPGPCSR